MSDHLSAKLPGVTADEANTYEVALDVVNDVIGWYSSAIWREKQQTSPDQGVIGRYEAAVAKCSTERRALTPADQPANARAIQAYGILIRQLRAGAA